jgi:hypothetical protein
MGAMNLVRVQKITEVGPDFRRAASHNDSAEKDLSSTNRTTFGGQYQNEVA